MTDNVPPPLRQAASPIYAVNKMKKKRKNCVNLRKSADKCRKKGGFAFSRTPFASRIGEGYCSGGVLICTLKVFIIALTVFRPNLSKYRIIIPDFQMISLSHKIRKERFSRTALSSY